MWMGTGLIALLGTLLLLTLFVRQKHVLHVQGFVITMQCRWVSVALFGRRAFTCTVFSPVCEVRLCGKQSTGNAHEGSTSLSSIGITYLLQLLSLVLKRCRVVFIHDEMHLALENVDVSLFADANGDASFQIHLMTSKCTATLTYEKSQLMFVNIGPIQFQCCLFEEPSTRIGVSILEKDKAIKGVECEFGSIDVFTSLEKMECAHAVVMAAVHHRERQASLESPRNDIARRCPPKREGRFHFNRISLALGIDHDANPFILSHSNIVIHATTEAVDTPEAIGVHFQRLKLDIESIAASIGYTSLLCLHGLHAVYLGCASIELQDSVEFEVESTQLWYSFPALVVLSKAAQEARGRMQAVSSGPLLKPLDTERETLWKPMSASVLFDDITTHILNSVATCVATVRTKNLLFEVGSVQADLNSSDMKQRHVVVSLDAVEAKQDDKKLFHCEKLTSGLIVYGKPLLTVVDVDIDIRRLALHFPTDPTNQLTQVACADYYGWKHCRSTALKPEHRKEQTTRKRPMELQFVASLNESAVTFETHNQKDTICLTLQNTSVESALYAVQLGQEETIQIPKTSVMVQSFTLSTTNSSQVADSSSFRFLSVLVQQVEHESISYTMKSSMQEVHLGWSLASQTTIFQLKQELAPTLKRLRSSLSKSESSGGKMVQKSFEVDTFLLDVDLFLDRACPPLQLKATSLRVAPKLTSVNISASKGSLSLEGLKFVKWSLMESTLEQYRGPNSAIDYENVFLGFGSIVVVHHHESFIGRFIEYSLSYWSAFRQWCRKQDYGPYVLHSRTPDALSVHNVDLSIGHVTLEIREPDWERSIRLKRRAMLHPKLRQYETDFRLLQSITNISDSKLNEYIDVDIDEILSCSTYTYDPNTYWDVLRSISKDSIYVNLAVLTAENVRFQLIHNGKHESTENCISFIRRMDSCSSPVYDLGSHKTEERFGKVWMREMFLQAELVEFRIRDYMYPLLSTERLALRGDFATAQVACPDYMKTDLVIPIKHNMTYTSRFAGLVPSKYYHDLTFDLGKCQISYGISYDPAITVMARAFNFLTSEPVTAVPDPNPMPWWDKLRYKYHGSLEANMDSLVFVLLSARDPYCVERIEVSLHATTLSMSTGRISLSCDRGKALICSDVLQSKRMTSIAYRQNAQHRSELGVPSQVIVVSDLGFNVNVDLQWKTDSKDPYQHYVHTFNSNPHSLFDGFRSKTLDCNVFADVYALAGVDTRYVIWKEDWDWYSNMIDNIAIPCFQNRVISYELHRDCSYSTPPPRTGSLSTCFGFLEVETSFERPKLQYLFYDRSGLNGIELRSMYSSFAFLIQNQRLGPTKTVFDYRDYVVTIRSLESRILTNPKQPKESVMMYLERSVDPFDSESRPPPLQYTDYRAHSPVSDVSGQSDIEDQAENSHLHPIFFFKLAKLTYQSPKESIPEPNARRNSLFNDDQVDDISGKPTLNRTESTSALLESHFGTSSLSKAARKRIASETVDDVLLDDIVNEHRYVVDDLKFLWASTIRRSFNMWWNFYFNGFTPVDMEDENHLATMSESLSSYSATNEASIQTPSVLSQQSIPSAASGHDADLDEMKALLEEPQSTAGLGSLLGSREYYETGTVEDSAILNEIDAMEANIHPHVPTTGREVTTVVKFIRPQINFRSELNQDSCVLIASNASVELGSYYLPKVADRLVQTFSSSHPAKGDDIAYKYDVDFGFDNAQMFIVANVDTNLDSVWVPLPYFSILSRNGFQWGETKVGKPALEPVTEPLSANVTYTYDSSLPVLDGNSSFEDEVAFRVRNCATIGSFHQNEHSKGSDNIDTRYFIPSSSLHIHVDSMRSMMNGIQFGILVEVFHVLFIAPTWKDIKPVYAMSLPTKEEMLNRILDLLSSRNEDNGGYLTAVSSGQGQVTQHVEYDAGHVSWTLRDRILARNGDLDMGKFMRAELSNVKGEHWFMQDESDYVTFDVGDARLSDLYNDSIILAPTPSKWAQRDPQTKILQVSADAMAPLVPSKARYDALRAVSSWNHFEVRVFPLSIDFSQSLYEVLKRYFFPKSDVDDQQDFIEYPKLKRSMRSHKLRSYPSNSLPAKLKKHPRGNEVIHLKQQNELTRIPPTNYFKFFRLSQVQLTLSYRGFVTLDSLELTLNPFVCTRKLADWDKLLYNFEKHVGQCVLLNTAGIVKNSFGYRKDPKEKKKKQDKKSEYFGDFFSFKNDSAAMERMDASPDVFDEYRSTSASPPRTESSGEFKLKRKKQLKHFRSGD